MDASESRTAARDMPSGHPPIHLLTNDWLADSGAGIPWTGLPRGRAEKLPFDAASFSLVLNRLAFHHFPVAEIQLREMSRVCKAGGTLAVADLLATGNRDHSSAFDRLESVRDPSHARLLSESGFRSMFSDAGLVIGTFATRECELSLQDYLDGTSSSADTTSVFRSLEKPSAMGS